MTADLSVIAKAPEDEGEDPSREAPEASEEALRAPGRARMVMRFVAARPFQTIMGLSAILCALYYGVLAAPLYVSEARFSIRSHELPVGDPLLAGLVGQTSSTLQESIAIRDYINSHDMLQALDSTMDLRALYGAARLDPFHQLFDGASAEDFLDFFRRMISTTIDREASIVTVKVRSFTAGSAKQIADAILALSETFVNDLSIRVRESTLRSARTELSTARVQVREARVALARFRNRTGDLDPRETGTGTLRSVMALEEEVTKLNAELASILTISQETSPQVQQMRARIKALRDQIQNQRTRLADADRDGTLAQALIAYEELVVDHEYADRRLISALTALDSARALAEQRDRFLVRVVNPNLPSEATEPRRFLSFCLTMLLTLVAYGIVSFTIAGIRDHRGVA